MLSLNVYALRKITLDLPCGLLSKTYMSYFRIYVLSCSKPIPVTETFVVMGKQSVYFMRQNTSLDPNDTDIVSRILPEIKYMGCARLLCTMQIIAPQKCHCILPWDGASESVNVVRVLASRTDVVFADILGGTKHVPSEAITITPVEMQKQNRIIPPEDRYVRYGLPPNLHLQKADVRRLSDLYNIKLVRYAIIANSNISITKTLHVGDLAKTACMSKYGAMMNGRVSSTFSGKTADGLPNLNHLHASYLPTGEAHNKNIDHLTVVAPGGFDQRELEALFKLERLYGRGLPDMQLEFQGCGMPGDFSSVPILSRARRWVSATPMVLTRHSKRRGSGSTRRTIDGPEEQVRRELVSRYGAVYEPIAVTVCSSQDTLPGTGMWPADFYRWRSHGSIGNGRPYGIILEFQDEVAGPITLGYASHFGLGMFVPENSVTKQETAPNVR